MSKYLKASSKQTVKAWLVTCKPWIIQWFSETCASNWKYFNGSCYYLVSSVLSCVLPHFTSSGSFPSSYAFEVLNAALIFTFRKHKKFFWIVSGVKKCCFSSQRVSFSVRQPQHKAGLSFLKVRENRAVNITEEKIFSIVVMKVRVWMSSLMHGMHSWRVPPASDSVKPSLPEIWTSDTRNQELGHLDSWDWSVL